MNAPSRDIQRARYKLALARRLSFDAKSEARTIAVGAERNAWLRIAREARQDARYWIRQLREGGKPACPHCGANAVCEDSIAAGVTLLPGQTWRVKYWRDGSGQMVRCAACSGEVSQCVA